jgi:Flp pilus assembly protein TadB
MIDWPLVVFGALWIGGAALALATLSYASWSASVRGEHLRTVLQQPVHRFLLLAAACLICVGLGLSAPTGLETVVWVVLAVISAAAIISLWRKMRRNQRL